MKLFSDRQYRFFRRVASAVFRVVHPVVRVKGRENIPAPGEAAVVCCNHSAFSDPIYLICHARQPDAMRILAKQELMGIPVLGKLYLKLGAIPLDRGKNDLAAMKTAMKTLRDGRKLLIFPEGTRIRKGKKSEPHSGAVLLSVRTGAPILPCYLTQKKRFLGRIDVVYGEPYLPQITKPKPDSEELQKLSAELMKKIYALGEQA